MLSLKFLVLFEVVRICLVGIFVIQHKQLNELDNEQSFFSCGVILFFMRFGSIFVLEGRRLCMELNFRIDL